MNGKGEWASLVGVEGVEVSPYNLCPAHAPRVPGLLPGSQLQPGHQELPQSVPVILETGAWEENETVTTLRRFVASSIT